MSLFIRNVEESYPEDCDLIWSYLGKQGTALFTRDKLETLWREFSEEEYCAGFLTFNEFYAEEFIHWLEEKD